jgi:hypothetical protein
MWSACTLASFLYLQHKKRRVNKIALTLALISLKIVKFGWRTEIEKEVGNFSSLDLFAIIILSQFVISGP